MTYTSNFATIFISASEKQNAFSYHITKEKEKKKKESHIWLPRSMYEKIYTKNVLPEPSREGRVWKSGREQEREKVFYCVAEVACLI